MSYAISAPLQAAIYARLTEALRVPVLDATDEARGGTWVLIGPEDVRDRSDVTGRGAEFRLVISVLSDASGFQEAKAVAGQVGDALVRPLELERGRVVGVWFDRAQARRLNAGRARRIDLTFRVRVEDNQMGDV
ncbi:DUF3168 domain-containing protein [Falsirhodobacter halotolerans]|uniref:DUF3168 domain-containing protein n=1 Tax=Falsirhodobacter halotolerans TaxID=1146892 RepID=UPI001FD36742|nr:DUF3168 domain-containing protein [Falsirhodobacter halotolerans]MCJ8139300.1 DUF3168 domain-containing protein [Falsirhodobacter halotolerans]